MKKVNLFTSACAHCRYYQPEGRRGGNCELLNVAVQSNWEACALGTPPFTPTWQSIEEMINQETSVEKENSDCEKVG